MGRITSAETVLKNAVKRTAATIKRKQPQRAPTFKAWTVSQLLEQYRDPRAILLEIASTPTHELAKQMHGTLADALAERRLCAQAVLPYVAQKLPVQVDMRHTRAIHLNIVDDRQYQELVDVAAEATDDSDGFSLQLLANATDEAQPQADSDRPAASQTTPQQQQRSLQWDITPGNKGMQRKNVTSVEPVTPPTTPTPTGEE